MGHQDRSDGIQLVDAIWASLGVELLNRVCFSHWNFGWKKLGENGCAMLLQTQPNCASGPVMIQALPQWIFPIFLVSTFCRAHKYSAAYLKQTLRRAEAIKFSHSFFCADSALIPSNLHYHIYTTSSIHISARGGRNRYCLIRLLTKTPL